MMKYGLIGEKLGHSFSKEIHESFAEYNYELKELKKEEVPEYIKGKSFCAINVTIPYKELVIPYLDEISEEAKKIGSVNTIVNRNGTLYGYNTDFFGMEKLLQKNNIDIKGKNVLILGSGGTSKTAYAVTTCLGAKSVFFVSRTPDNNKSETISYEKAYTLKDTNVIINTTPVGMYPNNDSSPISLDPFPNLTGVVDAIYNPLSTNLILSAKKRGIPASGGLYMLVAQAVKASVHFTGRDHSFEEINRVYSKILDEKRNIVFIGMPGCGKTTIGKALAKETNKEFIDLDIKITEETGFSPCEIIETRGEKAFRDIESKVLKEYSKKQGLIISTGGGAVLREENVTALRQNGTLVFLDRPLEKIPVTNDRPLSSDREKLAGLFKERYNLYKSIADIRHNMSEDPAENLESIRRLL